MPSATYIALASHTLGSTASTVTFGSIPNTYRDLVAVINIRGLTGTPTARGGYMSLNGAAASTVYVLSGGGTSSSNTDGADAVVPFANGHGVFIVNIMDYSATDKHKTILTRASSPTVSTWFIGSRYPSTNAVTSITFHGPDNGSDQFAVGSTFTLYGIAS